MKNDEPRKRQEGQLEPASQRRLADLEEELAAARQELAGLRTQLVQSDKMASIGQLAAGIAHEINNPIGFISSNLNRLHDYVRDIKRVLAAYQGLREACGEGGGADVAARAQEIDRIREEIDLGYIVSDLSNLVAESIEGSERVRQIVANLRDFSHVDSPDVTEEDVAELLEKTISVAWNVLKYKVQVVREYGPTPPLPCYGGKLGQVFLNLLVNAADAIHDRGTITIRTGSGEGVIWIEISDTGRGIAPENLSRIFEPFFTTKEVGEGTGLGLHLAHNIIEAHQGQLAVESTVNRGTTFRIELPLTGPPAGKGEANELAA